MLLQAEQMQKMTSISLKMVKVVILSENSCHFVSCSACKNSFFLISLKYVPKFNTENEVVTVTFCEKVYFHIINAR
jgi:hypothetical protein